MISGVFDFVCLCLSTLCKKTARAINTKLGRDTVQVGRSACIDPGVERSKVKVTRLWSVLLAWVCLSIRLLGFLHDIVMCWYTVN